MREFAIRLDDEIACRLEAIALSKGISTEELMARILSLDLDGHFAELDRQFAELDQAVKEARHRVKL